MSGVKYIELFLLIVLSVRTDYKLYKIKNYIIFPFLVIGIITNLISSQVNGFFDSIFGIIVPVIVLMILFILRMLGAGDIKLFSAIGSIMGLTFVIKTMILSFLAGGVISLILILIRKNGIVRIKYLISYLKLCIMTFSIQSYTEFDDKSDGAKFRFSYAIMLGTILNLVFIYYKIDFLK